MSRRLLVLGLFVVVSQVAATGCCCCVRQRIAARWHYFHGGPGCGPACCTPAFRIPTPVHGGPVVGPVSGAPGGCASCASPGLGPVAYGGPVGGPGIPVVTGAPVITGGPVITSPTPIFPGPTIEPSTGGTVPAPMPLPAPKPAN